MNLLAWEVASCASQSPEKYLLPPKARTEHVGIQNITNKAYKTNKTMLRVYKIKWADLPNPGNVSRVSLLDSTKSEATNSQQPRSRVCQKWWGLKIIDAERQV